MVKETIERKSSPKEKPEVEEIAIDGFDHVELYVGNALQACYYYHKGFGFDVIGYSGLETGNREKASYVLKQGSVQFVVSGGLSNKSEIAEHVHEHGDGVKSIGFRVRDAVKCYETAIARGAKSHAKPEFYEGKEGKFISASVHTYGDTIHKFIQRQEFSGCFAPGFKALDKKSKGDPTRDNSVGLMSIDHIVGNVELNKMESWVEFYEKVFGFYVYQYFDADDISTKYSSLVSKVMANKSGVIKLPINEPAIGTGKSQIQEYIDYYNAGGVQHIAITTRDIIATIAELKARGVEFLTVPKAYYDVLPERVGHIDEDMQELSKLGILVDRESDGYLLQLFTKPVEDRPTLFLEIIQRKGAKGFGKGNFKALFESIEHEQALRGNL